MRQFLRSILFSLFILVCSAAFSRLDAQSNSGTINGTVTDPSGAVIPGASVSVQNPVSAYSRTTTTDTTGHFHFPNFPFNPLSLNCHEGWFRFLRYRRGCQIGLARYPQYPPESRRRFGFGHGGSGLRT